MRFKVKFIKWDAGVPVVMLDKKTAEEIGVHTKERVLIKSRSGELSTIVDIIEGIVGKDEIAISSELKETMNLKDKQYVDVSLSDSPKSLDYIKKKLNGKSLSQEEINEIDSLIAKVSMRGAALAEKKGKL